MRPFCSAERPETLPVKNPKPQVTRGEHHDILYIRGKSGLLAKFPEGKRHAGMYRFPQRAVSYTHLDVYKRQPHDEAQALRDCSQIFLLRKPMTTDNSQTCLLYTSRCV